MSEDTIEILRAAHARYSGVVPLSLVVACYEVELEQMFEADRTVTLAELNRLISAFVASAVEGPAK